MFQLQTIKQGSRMRLFIIQIQSKCITLPNSGKNRKIIDIFNIKINMLNEKRFVLIWLKCAFQKMKTVESSH